MPAPLVSVVMPCFNAGRMLQPALKSVVAQTHPAVEIIFVDNASTDGSATVAERVLAAQQRPFRIVRCETPGANPARNLGYGFVNGDYVNWMDADDLMDADKIARQVAALETAPAYDIAYGDWTAQKLPPAYPPIRRVHTLRQVNDQLDRVLSGVWYPPHLYLLRRSAADGLQEAQAWHPERKVATDFEYSAIAALLGKRFLYVPGAHITYHVWSKGQISKATSYIGQVKSLESIFARLRDFAKSPSAKTTLSSRHKAILALDWKIWNLSRGSLVVTRLDGRRALVRHLASGRQIEVRPREAAVVKGLLENPGALATWNHAVAVERREPGVHDHLVVIETLAKLRSAEFLLEVARQEPPASIRTSDRPPAA